MTVTEAINDVAEKQEASAKALRNLSKVMIGVAEKSEGIPFPTASATVDDAGAEKAPEAKKEAATEAAKTPEKEVTKDDIFKLMSEKSQDGFTAQIKEALNELGAPKLSKVAEKDYPVLYGKLIALKKLGD